MNTIALTLAQQIERPLRAVVDRNYAEFAEARHWPQYARLLQSPVRLRNLSEVVAGMFHADCNAGKFHTRQPSGAELGAWVASKWPDIRPHTIVAGTCGDER